MTFKPKRTIVLCLFAGLLLGSPASAQSLLGGILGGDGGGGLLSVDSGPAGTSSVVNVGLGSGSSGDGGLLNLNLGGGSGSGLASADVTNRNGGLGVDANLLGGGTGVDLRMLGGNGNLLTGDLDLAGLGLDVDLNLGLGLGGGNGNNGQNGQNGVGGFGGGGTGGLTAFDATCSVADGRRVLQLAAAARVDPSAWRRASNIQVIPVRLCPAARQQVASIFRSSSKVGQLQAAVSGDPLIAASLDRTRYGIGNVFAVDRSGGALTVYVY